MSKPAPKRRPGTLPFTPSVTHPYTEREVKLQSFQAQRHFNRLFERAQISAYQIIVMLPVFSDHAETAECENILSGALDRAGEQMRELIAQCEARMEETAVGGLVRYTDATTKKVPIYTPHCGQFVGLVVSYDNLVQMLDTLWFNRAFTREQRDEAMRRANVLLSDILREMARLQQRVIAARERQRDNAREARAKEAAKLKAKAAAAAERRAGKLAPTLPSQTDESDASVGAASQTPMPGTPTPVDSASAGADTHCDDVEPARQVMAFVDDAGAPRVVDTLDGEFSGEHADDGTSLLEAAEDELDAAHEALAEHLDDEGGVAPAARVRKTAAARKSAPRKRAGDAVAAVAGA